MGSCILQIVPAPRGVERRRAWAADEERGEMAFQADDERLKKKGAGGTGPLCLLLVGCERAC